MGQVGAIVWAIASLSVIAMTLVLPAAQVHRTALVAIGIGGCAWGAFCGLVLDWRRLPIVLIHALTVAGIAAIAVAIALSGGARSPAWACLFYVIVYAAYFMRPPAAVAYLLGCVGVDLAAVLSSPGAWRAQGAATLIVAVPAFLVLGFTLAAGKRLTWTLRARAERLAAEQAALRRVATAAIGGVSADRFYQLVAVEAGQLLAAGGAGILRVDQPTEARILGSWARQPERQFPVGDRFPIEPGSDLARALADGRPLRVQQQPRGSSLDQLHYQSSIISPVRVAGRSWGFLAIVDDAAGALTADHERRLAKFGELIAAAVTSFEDRAALATQAATDPLTGVANHRTFRERLASDLARARRYGTPVALAIIDVDRFKRVNDAGGHEIGDEVLLSVSRQLSTAARAGDTLARIGGDEFAWIMPETIAEDAVVAVARAGAAIGGAAGPRSGVTISGGVCDSGRTSDPIELMRLADQALYASKAHGRDQVRVYAPSDAGELAAR